MTETGLEIPVKEEFLSIEELEYRLLYSIIVAGKSATFAQNALRRLLMTATPFVELQGYLDKGLLAERLREARVGNYTKIETAIRELLSAKLDLRTVLPNDLEMIHGIGPKTSRFFLLWTEPDAQYAALDVHVLRWMRTLGYDAPKVTPTGKKYHELEQAFLKEAENRRMSPRELDSLIWSQGSGFRDGEEQWERSKS